MFYGGMIVVSAPKIEFLQKKRYDSSFKIITIRVSLRLSQFSNQLKNGHRILLLHCDLDFALWYKSVFDITVFLFNLLFVLFFYHYNSQKDILKSIFFYNNINYYLENITNKKYLLLNRSYNSGKINNTFKYCINSIISDYLKKFLIVF